MRLFVIAVLLLTGLGGASAQRVELTVGATRRVAYLHVPSKVGKAAVFVFHGGEGNGRRIEAQTGLSKYADQHGFIAVYPDAGQGQWNDGRSTTATHGDDIAFVRALIDHLAERYGVDRTRVFATGASNGGMFTYRLACEATSWFAAFAPVIANLPAEEEPRCKPTRPAPLLILNGTQDILMRWNGGVIPSSPARGLGAGGRVISTPATVQFWAKANRCDATPEDVMPKDTANDGTTVVLHRYRNCRSGSAIEFYEIRGGGHNWPGSPLASAAPRAGTISREINTSELIVAFFRRFGL
jgi:polyhydroxybutyrate depolymerase